MDSPPWSPCSIIGHCCLVDCCCQFIWSFECIHSPPILAFVYVFSISNAFSMFLCVLFPCSPCVFICLQGQETKRSNGFAIAQANPSLVLNEQDVHTHSTFIASNSCASHQQQKFQQAISNNNSSSKQTLQQQKFQVFKSHKQKLQHI